MSSNGNLAGRPPNPLVAALFTAESGFHFSVRGLQMQLEAEGFLEEFRDSTGAVVRRPQSNMQEGSELERAMSRLSIGSNGASASLGLAVQNNSIQMQQQLNPAAAAQVAQKVNESNTWYVGGERHAWRRVQKFIWDTNAVATYKKTRNRSMGDVFSSKLSMWITHGCISPAQVVTEVALYERRMLHGQGASMNDERYESTYWVAFELLWRDFTLLAGLTAGNKLFHYGGVRQQGWKWDRQRGSYPVWDDEGDWQAWTEGRTGFPAIDAWMRELRTTGWLSNRGRQNVASFLVYNLNIDWRRGAAWFERHLLDHQVCANFVNWQSIAGIGWQNRDNVFNIIKQSVSYEPGGAYILLWVPELRDAFAQHGLDISS